MSPLKSFVLILFSYSILASVSTPKRVVSTSPVISEFISFLDKMENLVAVSNYCKNLKSLPTIGSAFGIDYEKLITLKSDFIFLESVNDARVKKKLDAIGIKYMELKFLRLQDIKESSYQIAKKLGVPFKSLDDLYFNLKPLGNTGKKVLILISEDTSSDHIKSVRAVSGSSFYSDILGLVGGINILYDSKISYPILDLEKLLSLNPDLILRIGQKDINNRAQKVWKKTAFKDKVKFMFSDEYVIPGPQVLKTYEKMRDVIREDK